MSVDSWDCFPKCRFGEEAGLELGAGGGEYVWVLDPIDGTKSFITGR
jgi:inositol-phosphate phosphatase/L-galactose 1-phosphate phosphatase/histidinol-phosphatase